MIRELGATLVADAERLDLLCVEGPEPAWLNRLLPFLGHKSDYSRRHLRQALLGPLDGLVTRNYVGMLGDRIATHAMVVGSRGIGLLAHVYTAPVFRRRGYVRRLLEAAHHECDSEFPLMTLGTGYRTPPYFLYESLGYASFPPERGTMKRTAGADVEEALYAPAATHLAPLDWSDWSHVVYLGLLPAVVDPDLPRATAFGLGEPGSAEGAFVRFAQSTPEVRQAVALRSGTGVTCGWAVLSPDERWLRRAWLLDVHVHPAFETALDSLADSVALPDGPVFAYAGTRTKHRLLTRLGFSAWAKLEGWYGDAPLEIWRR